MGPARKAMGQEPLLGAEPEPLIEPRHPIGRAAAQLPYVECAPGGRNTPLTATCAAAGVTVFPTWVIDGIQHNGVMEPRQLAVLTRFDWDKAGQGD